MNKERILHLADVVEGRKLANMEFDMSAFIISAGMSADGHPCKTAGCIGGWCKTLFNSEFQVAETVISHELGISGPQAMEIAYPPLLDKERNRGGWLASPKQAAALLRNFAKTGVVDWPKAMAQSE